MTEFHLLPDGSEISLENWDRLSDMEQKMVTAHPRHLGPVDKFLQKLEGQLSLDSKLVEKQYSKTPNITINRRRCIHNLIWRIERTVKAIMFLCYNDLSQSCFVLDRLILELFADLHRLCQENKEKDLLTAGYLLFVLDFMKNKLKLKEKNDPGFSRFFRKEILDDKDRLDENIKTIFSSYGIKKSDHAKLKNLWPESPSKRLELAGIQNEFSMMYQFLSMKTHSSYFDAISRIKESKFALNTMVHKPEEDVVPDVLGFGFEILVNALDDYFKYLTRNQDGYIIPEKLLSEMNEVNKVVNLKAMKHLAKKEVQGLGLSSFAKYI